MLFKEVNTRFKKETSPLDQSLVYCTTPVFDVTVIHEADTTYRRKVDFLVSMVSKIKIKNKTDSFELLHPADQ